MNFTFDGNISREVLENYLSRSVTAAGLYESKTLEDDLRAIREMGVKFLGRASGIWYMTMATLPILLFLLLHCCNGFQ